MSCQNPSRSMIVKSLKERFGVDPGRVKFLAGEEPWLPVSELTTIGRTTGLFKSLEEWFHQFIPARKEIIYRGRIVDTNGVEYTRSGVAKEGEWLPEMEPGEVADEHQLAASRALRNAMISAGFDPFKPGSVIEFETPGEAAAGDRKQDPVEERRSDLARIHILAKDCGLIAPVGEAGWDDLNYRGWLLRHYNVNTASGMNESERQSVITGLQKKCRELA